MQKIYKERIIGFEIAYNEMERAFELSYVYEGNILPETTSHSFCVMYDGNASHVFWEDDFGDLESIGVEFEETE